MTSNISTLLAKATKKTPTLLRSSAEAGTLKRLKMDSPQLNWLFSGGFPIGRIANFFGAESSGKSSIATYIAGQFQKHMPAPQTKIVYLDFERSFDATFATRLGLDCRDAVDGGNFIYTTPDTLEDAIDFCCTLIPSNEIAMIILDSDAAAPTRVQLVDEFSKATFGATAKCLAEGLRKLNILCANYNTTFVTISQTRANMNAFSHADAVTGGFASKFFPTTRNKVAKLDVIKEGNEQIGINMRVRNFKNKGGIAGRDALMKLYFGNGSNGIQGFNVSEEYLQFLIDLDIITQKGAFFTVPGVEKSIQGREKLQTWLDNNPDAYKEMRDKVDELLTVTTALDANTSVPEDDEDVDLTQISDPIDAASLAEEALQD
jgi:recombination protein RecA